MAHPAQAPEQTIQALQTRFLCPFCQPEEKRLKAMETRCRAFRREA